MYIPAIDHESYNLKQYFSETNEMIHEERKRTNVLIHCMAGVSRSITIIAAYLMWAFKTDFTSVYMYIK